MRLVLATTAILAAAAGRGGCDGSTATTSPYDVCADKACGESCAPCPPGTPPENCPVQTFAATACDMHGLCVTAGTFVCSPEQCAGKACGVRCDAACPAPAPCPPPQVCDGKGSCVLLTADTCGPPPADDCLGKACGAPCTYPCPPEGPCPLLPVATACNGNQTCAPPVPWDACYVPCAGKACGSSCRICPPDASGCFETAELKACDPNGRCVSATPSLVCPP